MKVLENTIPVVRGDDRYIAIATAELKKRIEVELQIPDPPKDMAKAILNKTNETVE